MSKYKSLDADSLSYEELMKNLEYNYSVGASEVVAETDKRVFEIIYKLAKGKKEYEMVGVLAQKYVNVKDKKAKLAKAAKQTKLKEKEKDLNCSKSKQKETKDGKD